MKLTIEINDSYIPILSKWASVSRTLSNAKLCCEELSVTTTNSQMEDRATIAFQELEQITAALDHFHYQTRTEIWRIKQDGK